MHFANFFCYYFWFFSTKDQNDAAEISEVLF